LNSRGFEGQKKNRGRRKLARGRYDRKLEDEGRAAEKLQAGKGKKQARQVQGRS